MILEFFSHMRRKMAIGVIAGSLGILGGFGAVTHAASLNPQGVPITPNFSLILTKNLNRQGMVLDASATPVLFLAVSSTSAPMMRRLQQIVAHTPGLHRPLMGISTFFSQPRLAFSQTQRWMRRDHVTFPVVVQEGPPHLYVRTVPTLMTAMHGHIVRYQGWPAIFAHLRSAITITVPPPAHASHPSSGKAKP